ncbi:uncharacterized protein C18orf19 homolog A-like isoform X1 [Cimex lectularius]|uniref:DUF1279 domain-containing protein n=1 Tax=Cimex lectularius TaxID=79782 RepID=A0A8I6S5K6_CIMLE|nr:uncharacterized protein C18orf19 homolog A-like isoform X1 [Cimex lectularius]
MYKNVFTLLKSYKTCCWQLQRSSHLPISHTAFQLFTQKNDYFNTNQYDLQTEKLFLFQTKYPFTISTRDLRTTYQTKFVKEGSSRNKTNDVPPKLEEEPAKLGLFQRFKQMYKKYWYVLVPVHLITSAGWFGGFYYCAKSGVDLVSLAEMLHFSDSIVEKLRSGGNSTAGYIAISYALYKIFTPLRYTVTLGGTTVAINYLTKYGYIKPMPKKAELQKMIKDRRDTLKERSDAMKCNIMKKFPQKKSI